MAIRIIEKGTIVCDKCKKELAKCRMIKQLLEVFTQEERFLEIECVECIALSANANKNI